MNDFATLSVRARNIFSREGVRTIDDLCNLTGREILNFRNMGVYTLKEIDEFLQSHGRSLGDTRNKTNDGELRDYFAAQAMVGYMAKNGFHDDMPPMVARAAYLVADAMLAERNKEESS